MDVASEVNGLLGVDAKQKHQRIQDHLMRAQIQTACQALGHVEAVVAMFDPAAPRSCIDSVCTSQREVWQDTEQGHQFDGKVQISEASAGLVQAGNESILIISRPWAIHHAVLAPEQHLQILLQVHRLRRWWLPIRLAGIVQRKPTFILLQRQHWLLGCDCRSSAAAERVGGQVDLVVLVCTSRWNVLVHSCHLVVLVVLVLIHGVLLLDVLVLLLVQVQVGLVLIHLLLVFLGLLRLLLL